MPDWTPLRSNKDYIVLRNVDVIIGWIVKIGDQWVARSADGTVRAEFDDLDEAKNFLTVMVSAGVNDESNL